MDQLVLQNVSITNVPGDGDCLFHSLAMEISRAKNKPIQEKHKAKPGAPLRAAYLDKLQNEPPLIQGVSAQRWVEVTCLQPLSEYCK